MVLAKADIQYKKPINGDIKALCTLEPTPTELTAFIKSFQKKKRARLGLTINVVEDGVIKACLNANFALVV